MHTHIFCMSTYTHRHICIAHTLVFPSYIKPMIPKPMEKKNSVTLVLCLWVN